MGRPAGLGGCSPVVTVVTITYISPCTAHYIITVNIIVTSLLTPSPADSLGTSVIDYNYRITRTQVQKVQVGLIPDMYLLLLLNVIYLHYTT